MARLHLDKDIRPVSEFRAHARELLKQVRSSRRPLVLTQRGQSAAVLLDVAEYERLMDELELLRDIRTAEEQLQSGEAIDHDTARERVIGALEE